MKIFDFNVHLPCVLEKSVNSTIAYDTKMGMSDLKFCYEQYRSEFVQNMDAANIMLFNQTLFGTDSDNTFFRTLQADLPGSTFTALIDFRHSDIFGMIETAYSVGVHAIKFHSYVQHIDEKSFAQALKAAEYAAQKGLFICIDTSYGTSKMYGYDNLKLACLIADNITSVPIVLLHSGGSRVLEAFLLADEKKNIFLETSFSLQFYADSSIDKDFAFAYRKVGPGRVLYGSDSPYVSLKESIGFTIDYLQKFHFSSQDIEDIMFNNAQKMQGWR